MPVHPIITLTSDWGLNDHYLASVKGAILSRLPNASIIDISHQVRHFDIRQAAFLIRNTYPHFPAGTIHIIDIDSIETRTNPHVVVLADGQYFIGADKGIFTLIFDKKPDQVIAIDVVQDSEYFTFPARDRFVKVACDIASGKSIAEMGDIYSNLNQKLNFQPVVTMEMIQGKVIYIDNYENVFSNISINLFREHVDKKPFTIPIRKGYIIQKISKAYDEVPEGEIVVLFASNGLLQIAINRGRAASLLGFTTDSPINILFG
jgi:S-adenosyl-L-methionine hydrolase (adenosine-forming)